MNILFIGDIVAKSGRQVVARMIQELQEEYEIEFIIANGENATHGKGISRANYDELIECGIDCITLGNHYGARKEIFNFIDDCDNLLRPYNLHYSIPGFGTTVLETFSGKKIRVTNLLGRAFINLNANNPFEALKEIIQEDQADIHIVDFHAEATGEKLALAYAFDGKIDALLGTHTHVQTRDYRLLPNGTAYISDVGMCGPYNGILGAGKEEVITRTWTGLSSTFTIEDDDDQSLFNAVILSFDNNNRCIAIKPIYKILTIEV